MATYRYGRYVYGPDPLALPYDVRGAVDEMGDATVSYTHLTLPTICSV